MLASPTDSATIKAGFPPQLQQLTGEAVLEDLVVILDHVAECGKSHRTATQPDGKLHIAIPASLWPNYRQTPYPARQVFPGHVPVYPPGTNSTTRANIDNGFAVINKAFTDDAAMDVALTERFYALIRLQDQSRLRQRVNNITAPTFIQVFEQAVVLFGVTTPSMRMEMKGKLTDPWNFRDGFQVLWDRIKRIRNFCQYCNSPIPEALIVDSALINISRSGAYKDAYLRFKQEPQNYLNLQQFFETCERDLKEVGMEAQDYGYGNNMYDILDDDAATKALKESLTDLSGSIKAAEQAHLAAGQQFQQAQQTDQLTAAMQTVQQMAASMQGLQQQVAMLSNQQQQPPQFFQLPPVCPPAPPQQQQRGGRNKENRGGANQQRAPQNPVRLFDNNNYCWSHGFHVEDDHTSATCNNPRAGHQRNATKANIMGGTTAGSHRVIRPQQAGKEPWRKPQRGPKQAAQQQQQPNIMPFQPMMQAMPPIQQQFRGYPQQQFNGNGHQQQQFGGNAQQQQMPGNFMAMPPMMGPPGFQPYNQQQFGQGNGFM